MSNKKPFVRHPIEVREKVIAYKRANPRVAVHDVARKFDLHHKTVYLWLNQAGFKARQPAPSPPKKITADEAWDAYFKTPLGSDDAVTLLGRLASGEFSDVKPEYCGASDYNGGD